MPGHIYQMGSDNLWHSPSQPDVIPGWTPDPTPTSYLWYGTTLFGQSTVRYKLEEYTGGTQTYKAAEYDTVYNGERGSGVIRVYNSGNNGAGTWSNARPSYVRAGQPTCYSYKYAAGLDDGTAFKQDLRDFLDSITDDERCWLTHWHEYDNDIPGVGSGSITHTQFAQTMVWGREVFEEAPYQSYSYRNGGQIKWGFILVGTPPFGHNTTASNSRYWRNIVDNIAAIRGGDDTLDYCGADLYNPAWDGDTRYVPIANWLEQMIACNQYTGLPFVIGEGGSARSLQYDAGQTVFQRDVVRADWFRRLFDAVIQEGFFDAWMYWRERAVKGTAAEQLANPFSTNMITPTGYNAQISPTVVPNGNYDAQPVCDVFNEYAYNSRILAEPAIPAYTGGAP